MLFADPTLSDAALSQQVLALFASRLPAQDGPQIYAAENLRIAAWRTMPEQESLWMTCALGDPPKFRVGVQE
jgi:hypothetical protein